MSDATNNLEASLDGEMALLRALEPVEPSPDCVSAVRAAVLHENARLIRARRWSRRAGLMAGVAAGLLLALTWLGEPAYLSTRGTPMSVDEAALAAWTDAMDRSMTRLTRLVDEGWLVDPPEADRLDVDDLLRGADRTIEFLSTL